MILAAFCFPAIIGSYFYFFRPLFRPDHYDYVNLLLPGFQGRDLQAGVYYQNKDATTYIITCAHQDALACDIPQGELTAVKATASARLTQTDKNGRVASVSCDIQGTTYAFCHAAHGTVDVHATLAPKHLNWMSITVTGVYFNPPSLTTSSSAANAELLIGSHATHPAGRNEI